MIDSTAIRVITADSITQDVATSHALDRTPIHISATTPDDLANLSPTAQAMLLKQRGLNVAEIADELEIPISAVLDDLGIAVASPQTKGAAA